MTSRPVAGQGDPTFFAAPEDFRAWLDAHAALEPELVVGFHKVGTGRPCMTWAQSVDEALCVGWIDGVRRRIDDEAYSIRFTPRRPRSRWSAVNVRRVAELEAEGRMRPEGLAVFRARPESEQVGYSYGAGEPAAQLRPEEMARLEQDAAGWAWFSAQPEGYRRSALRWVGSAKRQATREARLATLLTDSAAGRRLKHLSWGRAGRPPS